MTTIIAIANQKGGVAKTTTCLNLGHALSERGRRVLVCDLDPQASLTISLGFDVRKLSSTIYDVLLDTKAGLTTKDIVQTTSMKDVDVAPASIDLSKAEMDLFSEMNRERALKDALKPVQGAYDYILIDCPPSLSRREVCAQGKCLYRPDPWCKHRPHRERGTRSRAQY